MKPAITPFDLELLRLRHAHLEMGPQEIIDSLLHAVVGIANASGICEATVDHVLHGIFQDHGKPELRR